MIDLAIKHVAEINERYYDAWFDPRYQYFFGQRARFQFEASDCLDRSETYLNRGFASLNPDGKVIGYIGYSMDTSIGLVHQLEIIKFSDDGKDTGTFGLDMYKVFKDCFDKFNANTIEFWVYVGNPIERSYDRICERLGGRILCTQNKRGILLDGTLLDRKVYQITKEEYLAARKKNDEIE